jgi:hypothetical protein
VADGNAIRGSYGNLKTLTNSFQPERSGFEMRPTGTYGQDEIAPVDAATNRPRTTSIRPIPNANMRRNTYDRGENSRPGTHQGTWHQIRMFDTGD